MQVIKLGCIASHRLHVLLLAYPKCKPKSSRHIVNVALLVLWSCDLVILWSCDLVINVICFSNRNRLCWANGTDSNLVIIQILRLYTCLELHKRQQRQLPFTSMVTATCCMSVCCWHCSHEAASISRQSCMHNIQLPSCNVIRMAVLSRHTLTFLTTGCKVNFWSIAIIVLQRWSYSQLSLFMSTIAVRQQWSVANCIVL